MSGESLMRVTIVIATAVVMVTLPNAAAANRTANPTSTSTDPPAGTTVPGAVAATISPTTPSPTTASAPKSNGEPDLAAIGATVRAVGVDRVRLKVGVKNVGTAPAVLPPDSATWHPVIAYVYLPEDTFGLIAPYSCAGWDASPEGWDWLDPGRPSYAYACLGMTLPVGATTWIELTVTVDRSKSSAPGYIRTGVFDNNPANDKANITVYTKAAPTTSPTVNNTPGLPITGGSSMSIAAGGVALIMLGAFAVLLSRHRRAASAYTRRPGGRGSGDA
jgi:hypothetical protein